MYITLTDERLRTRLDRRFAAVLGRYKWSPRRDSSGSVYAQRTEYRKTGRRNLYLHREVARLAGLQIAGKQVDHRSMDTLDNRARNLRAATPAQNRRNRVAYRNNTSGYKGVSWHKATEKWAAHIRVNGRRIHLGLFVTKVAAARAYNRAARELHGEFARLNAGVGR